MVPSIRTIVLAAAMAGSTLTACSSASSGSETSQPMIATTVSPLTSIAAGIAGDNVRIVGIVPEGTNSHTFEPAPQVAETLSTADLILVNGLKLEDPTLALAEANKKDGAEIVKLGDRVLPESEWIYDFSFPKEEGKPNPHLWTDPGYGLKYAAIVRDELSRIDPDKAATYKANYDTFAVKVSELSDALRKDSATVPGGVRLLTYHDAYAYVAKEYGWKVVGAIQPKSFDEPTPSEIANLINQVREQKVPTIFGSEAFPSPVLEEIGKETGARYVDTLRDDDLPGKPGDPDHSWLALMRGNYVTMIEGLGGTATNLKALNTTLTVPDNAEYPQ